MLVFAQEIVQNKGVRESRGAGPFERVPAPLSDSHTRLSVVRQPAIRQFISTLPTTKGSAWHEVG